MGRVPDEELEQLKREVSVQRLAEARGIALVRHGADLHGLCPFHEDRNPSLVISPERNLWHCLGACQAGGSVIDWVMRSEGVSFRHAVELLRADAPLSTATKPVKVSTVRRLPPPVLLKLEELQDASAREACKPKTAVPALTDAETSAALALLEDPHLLNRIVADFERCGVLPLAVVAELVAKLCPRAPRCTSTYSSATSFSRCVRTWKSVHPVAALTSLRLK